MNPLKVGNHWAPPLRPGPDLFPSSSHHAEFTFKLFSAPQRESELFLHLLPNWKGACLEKKRCGHREPLPTGGAAAPWCLPAAAQRSCVFIPTWWDEQITLYGVDGGSGDPLVWIPAEKRCSRPKSSRGLAPKRSLWIIIIFLFPALMQKRVQRS